MRILSHILFMAVIVVSANCILSSSFEVKKARIIKALQSNMEHHSHSRERWRGNPYNQGGFGNNQYYNNPYTNPFNNQNSGYNYPSAYNNYGSPYGYNNGYNGYNYGRK